MLRIYKTLHYSYRSSHYMYALDCGPPRRHRDCQLPLFHSSYNMSTASTWCYMSSQLSVTTKLVELWCHPPSMTRDPAAGESRTCALADSKFPSDEKLSRRRFWHWFVRDLALVSTWLRLALSFRLIYSMTLPTTLLSWNAPASCYLLANGRLPYSSNSTMSLARWIRWS